MEKPDSLIRYFAQHRVAANLLMIMMLAVGLWGVLNIHTQLNPAVSADTVAIDIDWPGASAEDVERLITEPIEYQLRALDDLEDLHSTTSNAHAALTLRFKHSADIQTALDRVKQQLAQVKDLPAGIEPPQIKIEQRRELVAMVLLTGDGSSAELAALARQYQRDLLNRGIDKISLEALPAEEIAIQISTMKLLELDSSLDQLALAIADSSADVPFGSVGQGHSSRQLRSAEQRRDVNGFRQLTIKTPVGGDIVNLDAIADIQWQARDHQVVATHNNRSAVVLRISAAADADTLQAAAILHQWLAELQPQLSQGVEVKLFLEVWLFSKNQADLVAKNGLGGLLLVGIALLIFLNGRVAWWVMVGIPVSFMAAIAAFYSLGGTLNIISMIALVMALGIVVDDAIVVAEHSLSQFEQGLSPAQAAAEGASSMFAPVMASSLTTMAAFLPLIFVGSEQIRELPIVMLLVIGASIIECFLIMPGHLRASFSQLAALEKRQRTVSKGWAARRRQGFDQGFIHFRQHYFLPLLRWALHNRRSAISLALALFMVSVALLLSGRIKPELNLNINFDILEVGIQFTGGATEQQKRDSIIRLTQSMKETEQALGGSLIGSHLTYNGMATIDRHRKTGYQYAFIQVEMVSPEQRTVGIDTFSQQWRKRLPLLPYVETLQIQSGNNSWPDLSLHLKGTNIAQLKAASEELQGILAQTAGVHFVYDDLPYGQEQWLFTLTAQGQQLGLTPTTIGSQIYAAYEGYRVQLFNHNGAQIEVRVKLPDSERKQLSSLRLFPIKTPAGDMVPLATVAQISRRHSIDVIQHVDGVLAVNINAYVDKKITTAMSVIAELEQQQLPQLVDKYQLQYGLSGNSAEESGTLNDLMTGALMAMLLIYLILVWSFSSYTWPLAVIMAIPLALTGALFALQLVGLNLGVMAIMGLFTLAGVIVNDAIILVTAFKHNREQGMALETAIEQAACSRLRAVILTSLTTTLGLLPMLLETSPIGAAMSPLAVVVCGGMLYGTGLILIIIPALLYAIEERAPSVKTSVLTQSSPNPATAI